MSRYIDADRLKTVIEKNFGHGTVKPILQLIDIAPTADEIVRCENCIHRDEPSNEDFELWCLYLGCNMNKNDFCSYGEKE